ncbi:uL13 family ribosomal protein [Candidatus Parcubacteria bacterium]|nr:uL13 family ribosomal protein [Candidatus Parcubacteria bacterium]
MKYILDAQGKKIGRVASEAAKLLMGKNSPEFVRNAAPEVEVEIINASKADVPVKKMDEKLHARFSGFPSGITVETVGQVIGKKGHKELFRRAVHGMLPRNKLRAKMIRHLKITE